MALKSGLNLRLRDHPASRIQLYESFGVVLSNLFVSTIVFKLNVQVHSRVSVVLFTAAFKRTQNILFKLSIGSAHMLMLWLNLPPLIKIVVVEILNLNYFLE